MFKKKDKHAEESSKQAAAAAAASGAGALSTVRCSIRTVENLLLDIQIHFLSSSFAIQAALEDRSGFYVGVYDTSSAPLGSPLFSASPIEGLFALDELGRSAHGALSGSMSELDYHAVFVEDPRAENLRLRPELWKAQPILGDSLVIFINATSEAKFRSHPDYRMSLVLAELDNAVAFASLGVPSSFPPLFASKSSGSAAGAGSSAAAGAPGSPSAGSGAASGTAPAIRADVIRSLRQLREAEKSCEHQAAEAVSDVTDLKMAVRLQQVQINKLLKTVEELQHVVADREVLSISLVPKGLQRIPCGKFFKTVWTWRFFLDQQQQPPPLSDSGDRSMSSHTQSGKPGSKEHAQGADHRGSDRDMGFDDDDGHGSFEMDRLSDMSEESPEGGVNASSKDQQQPQAEGADAAAADNSDDDEVDISAEKVPGRMTGMHSLRPFVRLNDDGNQASVTRSGRYLICASLRFVDVSENVFLCINGKRKFRHGGGEYAWSNFHLTVHFNQVVDLQSGDTISFETDAGVDRWDPTSWMSSNSLFLTRLGPL